MRLLVCCRRLKNLLLSQLQFCLCQRSPAFTIGAKPKMADVAIAAWASDEFSVFYFFPMKLRQAIRCFFEHFWMCMFPAIVSFVVSWVFEAKVSAHIDYF